MTYIVFSYGKPLGCFNTKDKACYFATEKYLELDPINMSFPSADFDDIYDEFFREMALGEWKIVEEEN